MRDLAPIRCRCENTQVNFYDPDRDGETFVKVLGDAQAREAASLTD